MQNNYRVQAILAVAMINSFAVTMRAQTVYDTATFVSRADAALGYQYIRSNSPPNGEPTFSAHGAFVEVHAGVWRYIGIAGEATGTRATDISALGQNLTLTAYTAGPRATLQGSRLSLYVQALFGAAHGSDSYFPTATGYTTSASSFAYSGGAGIDYHLSHLWAVRGEVQYLHTAFPNGVDDSQQHLMLGAGLVYRFGGHYSHPRGRQAQPVPLETAVQPLAQTQAPQTKAPLPPPAEAMVFTPITPGAPVPAEDRSRPEFRANVKNVRFESGNYGLSVEALSALANAATYLRLHTGERVVIGSSASCDRYQPHGKACKRRA